MTSLYIARHERMYKDSVQQTADDVKGGEPSFSGLEVCRRICERLHRPARVRSVCSAHSSQKLGLDFGEVSSEKPNPQLPSPRTDFYELSIWYHDCRGSNRNYTPWTCTPRNHAHAECTLTRSRRPRVFKWIINRGGPVMPDDDGRVSSPMTDIPTAAIIAFWAGSGIILVGCRDGPSPQQAAQLFSQTEDHKPGNAETETEDSLTYVTCQATLASLDKDHPWFEDSISGHDDGKARLASFVLLEPATYANHTVGILFKYTASSETPSPPNPTDVGDRFTFQIPEDFFAGKHKTIDNASVRNFRKVKP